MKTLLLLGASYDQIFAIKTAKSMGLHVLVLDMNPNSPGFAFADEYAVVSTRDVSGIKSFIDEYLNGGKKIDGVLVMGSDIPEVVSQIASYIGTPGISFESAILAKNKFKMKERFKQKGIPIPWFSSISTFDELKKIVKERGFPLIIKPIDSSGSRGVYLISKDDCLQNLFDKTRSFSSNHQVLVEEYLSGLQLSTETIMHNGHGYTVGFADRNYEFLKKFSPKIIENGGTVPTSISNLEKIQVGNLIEQAALSLGITDGVVKGDLVLTKNGPFIIELAARLSGGDFSESLIPLGSGVNIVRVAIKIALNEKPDLQSLKSKCNRVVVNRYFFPSPGVLEKIEGLEKIKEQPWIKKLEFWYKPGDEIPEIIGHGSRFGVFIIEGNDINDVKQKISYVYKTIKIITSPK